jgi:hypothetical protein
VKFVLRLAGLEVEVSRLKESMGSTVSGLANRKT